jgi:hypothetical protein
VRFAGFVRTVKGQRLAIYEPSRHASTNLLLLAAYPDAAESETGIMGDRSRLNI